MIFCELTLAVYKPSSPSHRRRTGSPGGAVQRGVRLDLGGVAQSALCALDGLLVCFLFIIYFFIRLQLCNNYFHDIVNLSLYTLLLYVLFFLGALMRRTRLYPLNSSVTGCLLRQLIIFYPSLILRTTCVMPSTVSETCGAPSLLRATDGTKMR
jgi:hypothetical protein